MTLTDLPAGTDVFVDANIFIYAFGGQSAECKNLLARCASEDVFGITTFEVINEVTHRLMIADAFSRGLINKSNANTLKQNRAAVRQLIWYWQETARIFDLNVLILDTNNQRLYLAQNLRTFHGLLTNDSLIIAAMHEYGVTSLASRDNDFDHIPILTVYKPTDI